MHGFVEVLLPLVLPLLLLTLLFAQPISKPLVPLVLLLLSSDNRLERSVQTLRHWRSGLYGLAVGVFTDGPKVEVDVVEALLDVVQSFEVDAARLHAVVVLVRQGQRNCANDQTT